MSASSNRSRSRKSVVRRCVSVQSSRSVAMAASITSWSVSVAHGSWLARFIVADNPFSLIASVDTLAHSWEILGRLLADPATHGLICDIGMWVHA